MVAVVQEKAEETDQEEEVRADIAELHLIRRHSIEPSIVFRILLLLLFVFSMLLPVQRAFRDRRGCEQLWVHYSGTEARASE